MHDTSKNKNPSGGPGALDIERPVSQISKRQIAVYFAPVLLIIILLAIFTLWGLRQ